MARLPSSEQLSGPDSLRSGRVIASSDTSAAGAGLASLGGVISQIGEERKAQQSTLDITRAEAYKTEGLLGVQNEFDQDPDYSTYGKRAPARTGEVINNAANLIRDPSKRELWLAGARGDAARVNDGIFDKAATTQKSAEIVAFDDALEVNRRLYVDPDTPDDLRAKARSDIEASISMAQEVGLLDPVTADARRKAFIEDAEFSRGKLAVARDPSIVAEASPIGQVVNKIIGAESSGNPNAKNPKSSAEGLGQFIDSTWLATVKRYRPDIAAGKTNSEILSLKTDAALSREMTTRLTEGNAQELASAGYSVTPGNIYLAHFLGASGAKAALGRGDDVSLESFLSADAIESNPFLKGKSVGWIKAWAARKMDGPTAGPSWYQNLSPEQRADIDSQAATQQRQMQSAANAQLTAEQTAIKDTFSLRIATDDPTLSEREILDNSVIDNGAKASLINSLRSQTKEARETAAALDAFGRGALNVDPYDSTGRKVVDNMFETASRAVDPEQVQPLGEEIVRQSGVVPQRMLNGIRRDLGSTDVNTVLNAAQSAYRISQINPAALARRDGGSEAQGVADDFGYYVDRLNMAPEEAARRIMDARDPQKKRDRRALEPAAKAFVDEMQEVDIANEFDTWFGAEPSLGFTPAQEAGMRAEFMAIAEDKFYASNGDPELARNRAMEEFQRIYGVTDLTGKKTVMRNPPERYWPKRNGAFTDPLGYAKDQLARDGVAADPTFNVDTLQLVPTRETEAMIKRGEMPGYAVMWTDENGVLQTMPGMLWRPDPSGVESEFEAEQRDVIEGALQSDAEIKAGRKRDRQIAAEGDAAMDGTQGPDWMRARAKMDAEERARQNDAMQADDPDDDTVPQGDRGGGGF